MTLTPDEPFPKSRGDVLRSKDWNDSVNEIRRLGLAKVNKTGDAISGPLTVAGSLGVGTNDPVSGALFVANSGSAASAAVIGITTPNNADFLGISGGRESNRSPHIVWRRGNLRLGTAATFGGQGFSEKLRITSGGNVGIGIDPLEKLHLTGAVRGDQAGALRISTGTGYVDVGPKNEDHAHFETDRPAFYFNKPLRIDGGQIGSFNENLQLQTSMTTRLTINNDNGYVGIGGIAGHPLHVTAGAPEWQARFTNGAANTYLSHQGGFGVHINTGGDNSSGRYGLEVRNSTQTHLYVRDDGNVGLGNNNPQDRLDINGALRFGGNAARRVYGDTRAGHNTVVLGGNWDELEVKGRVIDWTGSNLHIGFSNDHSTHMIEMGRNVGDLRFMAGGSTTMKMQITDKGVFGAASGPNNQLYRIAVGASPALTNWVQYNANGVYADIDTTSAGFTATPYYFSSLGGNNSHWDTQGATSIYSPTATGFRVYVNQAGITVATARSRRWHINWIAIGR